MKIKISPSGYNRKLSVPSSKSWCNRALVLGAISKKLISIKNISDSSDVIDLINALKVIGLELNLIDGNIEIKNSFPECEQSIDEPVEISVGDGGTTSRFLTALLAKGKNRYHINASKELRERPIDELVNAMKELGVDIQKGRVEDSFWLSIQGPILKNSGEINVDSSRSTQFATALSLALSDSKNLVVNAKNMENSQKYFEMTLDLISQFQTDQREFIAPVDFSSISYPLALGLLKDGITINNCYKRDFFQADSVLLEIIESIGGQVNWSADGLSVLREKLLTPIIKDCSGFPDLVPTLAFIASFIDGESRLLNLEVLRFKESDRILEIERVLTLFEVDYDFDKEKNDIVIRGSSLNKSSFKQYNAPADHRLIMMSHLFMKICDGGEILNYHHVKKSFPNYFKIVG